MLNSLIMQYHTYTGIILEASELGTLRCIGQKR